MSKDHLRVKIHFKSGMELDVTSNTHYSDQFRIWCEHEFRKPDGNTYDYIMWNDTFINVREIEYVRQVKEATL